MREWLPARKVEVAVPGKISAIKAKFLRETDHADGDQSDVHNVTHSTGMLGCCGQKPTVEEFRLVAPAEPSN